MNRPNRSHPTLGPLTTLPTFPNTSPSYLYPSTSIPTTPSLLSRPSSQTRLRPARSTPTAVPTPSASTPSIPKNPAPKKKRTIRNTNDTEDDWVTRTASTLTLTRLEEKGQSWLAARNSSTSLTGGEVGDEEYFAYEPGWNTSRGQSTRGSSTKLRGLSRAQSRAQSRVQSRAQSRRGSIGGDGVSVEEEEEIGPDFVDVEEGGEEQGEETDEGEMKRVVMGRVGGWVDWAVGWMDFRGEGEEEEDADEVEGEGAAKGEYGEAESKGELDPVELDKRLRNKRKKDDEAETGGEGTNAVSSAPEQGGVWSDARWLLGVASKVAL